LIKSVESQNEAYLETCKRYSHQRGFKVKFRENNEEEIEKRYVRKNLIQDQFDKIEDLQQQVNKVESGFKDQHQK
jgi:hypothetical protein